MAMQILLVCTPLTERLYGWLTVTEPPAPADAIVCLGGDMDRVLWAAEFYHHGFAPRVVVTSAPGHAEQMRDLMVMCGVPADRVLVDATSRTTWDHPAGIAKLPGIDPATQRFIIVTDHEHSRRSALCFRRQGYRNIRVCAGPRFFRENDPSQHLLRDRIVELPHLAYEYAALLQYRLQGRI